MSCKHGNYEGINGRDCDLCDAEDEIWKICAAKDVEIADLKAAYESLFKENAARLAAALASPAPQPAVTEGASKGAYVDAFLCRAWGETELTSAEIVEGWEGVRAFMVREWLGEEGATNGDGGNTLDQLKVDFDEHQEDMRGGPYTLTFEIGGVSVERVTGWTCRAPAAAVPESPAGYFLRAGYSPQGDGTKLWEQVADEHKNDVDVVALYERPTQAPAATEAPSPLSVACPHCWQKAGEPCIWPETRKHNRDAPHDARKLVAVGASVQPVQASLSDERPPIKWPKARDVGRLEDMSPDGVLRVGLDNDGDAYVSVWTERGGGVEFCTSGNGGGRSPRTREALLALMVAMEADNAQDPRRDWWAQRNLASSTPTKGGQTS